MNNFINEASKANGNMGRQMSMCQTALAYELSDRDFEKISSLVYELCGINLHDGKRELVKARLGKRLREMKLTSFSDYYKYVTNGEGAGELITMIDSLSTNLTSFFREEKHFRKLREILSESGSSKAQKAYKAYKEKLIIWSAGCSTGEEPYSLAMTVKEMMNHKSADLKIIATDISTRVLKKATAGIYHEDKVKNIPHPLLKKYFQAGQGRWKGHYRVKRELREIIEFFRFNLMDHPSVDTPYDVIFCRNVMIYFDKKTQEGLISRFYSSLKDGGYLFVGHSESLTGLNHRFKHVEPSVYRK